MKIIISGGGTGGHLYPALAIGREFAKLGAEILYIGSEYGIEKTIMPAQEFSYKLLPVKSVSGRRITELPKVAMLVAKSTSMAKKIIADFKPDLIAGTGGYASYPVLKAGEALGVKTLLHEANAEIGKANLNLANMCDCLCVTYADTAEGVKSKHVVVTGMPVRDSVKTVTREEGGEYVGIDDDTLLVTVTGGSQGAHHINEAMADYYSRFVPAENAEHKKILFYHIVGTRNEEDAAKMQYPFVRVKNYEEQMDKVLARTDICIGRAGASFLAEVTVKGIPSILVPYPFSGGHQEKNAAYYHRCGGARMVLDGNMPQELGPVLDELIAHKDLRDVMSGKMQAEAKPDALDVIIREGLSLINNK